MYNNYMRKIKKFSHRRQENFVANTCNRIEHLQFQGKDQDMLKDIRTGEFSPSLHVISNRNAITNPKVKINKKDSRRTAEKLMKI